MENQRLVTVLKGNTLKQNSKQIKIKWEDVIIDLNKMRVTDLRATADR